MNRTLVVLLFFQCLFSNSIYLGYKHWIQANPKIKVVGLERSTTSREIQFEIQCAGSQELKISSYNDFRGAEWRDISALESWRLSEEKGIQTVFFLFKKSRSDDSEAPALSSVFSYSVDLSKPYKKLTQVRDLGYIDWSQNVLELQASFKVPESISAERYPLRYGAFEVKKNIRKNGFELIKDVKVNNTYTVFELLGDHSQSLSDLGQIIDELEIERLTYPGPREVFIQASIRLNLSNHEPGINQILQNQIHPILKDIKKETSPYKHLVIDTRNLFMTPCLFPRVLSEKGEVLASSAYFIENKNEYVRYIRDYSDEYEIPWFKDLKQEEILFIKALELAPRNSSDILISQRYTKKLIESEMLYSLNQGNLTIIVD